VKFRSAGTFLGSGVRLRPAGGHLGEGLRAGESQHGVELVVVAAALGLHGEDLGPGLQLLATGIPPASMVGKS